jgi:hypothetical protein
MAHRAVPARSGPQAESGFVSVPSGTLENSPAIHRWEEDASPRPVPEGRLKTLGHRTGENGDPAFVRFVHFVVVSRPFRQQRNTRKARNKAREKNRASAGFSPSLCVVLRSLRFAVRVFGILIPPDRPGLFGTEIFGAFVDFGGWHTTENRLVRLRQGRSVGATFSRGFHPRL